MRTVIVTPIETGWSVDVAGMASPMYFASGRFAESTARSLASRLATMGQPVELEIHLRDGALAENCTFHPSRSARQPLLKSIS